jgi:D-alanyl-D-alanine carboxypeptidase (penicillin-binding protein 5/6)
MNDTTFKNCNGLDEDGHVTSAYDVAVMSRELMKHQKIFDYTGTWMDSLRDGKTQLVNTNKLLKSYKGITGLKTGTTSKAGSCISATAMRDGMHLIAVVLGASNTKDRFNSAATLLNYGFANWSLSALEVPEEAYQPLKIQNGMENEVPVTIANPGSALVSKGKGEEVQSTVSYDEFLEVPIQKGQQVGEITYSIGDETVGSVPILAAKDIEKAELMPVFHLLLQNLFSFSDK